MALQQNDAPPLTPADAQSIPTWRAAYSDRTAAMMAKFSQLAYVPFVEDQGPPVPGAPKREKEGGREQLGALLAAGNFTLNEVFNVDNVQAFLAVNAAEFAVLSFRGTANFQDWLIDLDAVRIPLPGFPGVEVHRGFWNAFVQSKDDIVEAVDAIPPDLGLYITGHSLGGALAQIASAVLERDTLAACYTFGSPRAATRGFDRDVKCPHYRLINHWDLVPGVPLPAPWGYQHTGDPRLLSGEHPKAILRRDRNAFVQVAADLASAALSPWTRTLFTIDDHMIWNYREQLETIAVGRTHRTAEVPEPPPLVTPATEP